MVAYLSPNLFCVPKLVGPTVVAFALYVAYIIVHYADDQVLNAKKCRSSSPVKHRFHDSIVAACAVLGFTSAQLIYLPCPSPSRIRYDRGQWNGGAYSGAEISVLVQ
jgi:hypothetical protein